MTSLEVEQEAMKTMRKSALNFKYFMLNSLRPQDIKLVFSSLISIGIFKIKFVLNHYFSF